MEAKNMDRREALKRTAVLLGGTISAPTILGIMNGCTPSEKLDWSPVYFDQEQASLLNSITDTIIPGGDTKGANDVGVPQFIEQIVNTIYSDQQKKEFMDGLRDFADKCEAETGGNFNDLEREKKEEFFNKVYVNVKDIEDELEDEREGKNIEDYSDTKKIYFVKAVKELTVSGYCLSEYGATQILKYVKVPGEYKGCIPYDEVGGVWATG